MARRAFTSYAEQFNPGLVQWMREHTKFPNSMVDRITPVTTPEVIERLDSEYDIPQDAWPVVAEPFAMSVIEDDFADGRPPLDKAGVQLVDDVSPYEAMKLRLLNASHQGLCYFAYLAGYRLVHEAAQDPMIAEFLCRYMDSEAMPTLTPIPGLTEFKDELIPHFANAYIRDTVARLCAESSDRIPKIIYAGGSRQPPIRRPGAAVRGDRRELGPLHRGRRRTRPADRSGGPARGHARCDRPLAAGQSERISAEPLGFRRPGRRVALRRAVPVDTGLAAPSRRAHNAADAARGV